MAAFEALTALYTKATSEETSDARSRILFAAAQFHRPPIFVFVARAALG